MINFCEERFPTDVSYGMTGGPSFHTEIVETVSGKEYRNIRTPYGKNKYNLASGIKTKEQLDNVIKFFRAMKGRGIAFRFKDWLDFKVQNQFIAISDGKEKNYQIIKTYEVSTVIEVRKIIKPIISTIQINVSDKPVRGFTVNEYGMVSFFRPLPKGTRVTASCEFDVPVRFDRDHITGSINSYNVHELDDISLIEVVI